MCPLVNPNVFSHMFLEPSNLNNTDVHSGYFGSKRCLKPHLLNLHPLESPFSPEKGRLTFQLRFVSSYSLCVHVHACVRVCDPSCMWEGKDLRRHSLFEAGSFGHLLLCLPE